MGFNTSISRKSLIQTGGELNDAIQWLLNNGNESKENSTESTTEVVAPTNKKDYCTKKARTTNITKFFKLKKRELR